MLLLKQEDPWDDLQESEPWDRADETASHKAFRGGCSRPGLSKNRGSRFGGLKGCRSWEHSNCLSGILAWGYEGFEASWGPLEAWRVESMVA